MIWKVRIRLARPWELPDCARLAVAVARATFTWNPPDSMTEALFLADAAEEEIYVARLAWRTVGLLAFYRPENFVHTLAVDFAHRGRGIGRALLAHAAARADGPLSLKVEVPNARAIAFYEHVGWQRAAGPDATGVSPYGVQWLRFCNTPGTQPA